MTPREVSRAEKKADFRSGRKTSEKRRQQCFEVQQRVRTEVEREFMPSAAFVQFYYSYLQKLALNVDAYALCVRQVGEDGGAKHAIVSLFRVQNLMQVGLKLVGATNSQMAQAQQLIYNDMATMQAYAYAELGSLLQRYSTLSTCDVLSVFEIYQDTRKCEAQLSSFLDALDPMKLDAAHYRPLPSLGIDEQLLVDFTNFAAKLRTLATCNLKKQMRVPTKNDP